MCNHQPLWNPGLGRWLLAGVLVLLLNTAMAVSLEDPTRPPGATVIRAGKTVTKPSWVLSSTLISPERRSAIINGKQVTLGDRVNGARVVEIEPAAVKLRNRGGEFSIRLVRNSVVKKSWSQPQDSAIEK